MAKKKRKSAGRKKAPVSTAPQHVLPNGFWAQVGAVLLIVFSLLIILGWFGLGGPVLDWLNQVTVATIGYGVYVVPVVFMYVAVEIFRAEDNPIPFVMKFATAIELIWFAGLFGLLKNSEGKTTGGFVETRSIVLCCSLPTLGWRHLFTSFLSYLPLCLLRAPLL